jgi:type I restriction enzyme, S subunit
MEVESISKSTEVGIIPSDWNAVPIGLVCKLINGRGFKPYEWRKSGLPIIRIQNLNGSSEFNYFDSSYNKKLEVTQGQLLFAWSGSRGTSFGPHVWNGPTGVLNYHTWKVQVDQRAIDQDYFLHALKELTTYIEGKAHGASALVHTQKWEMEGFLVPIPPTKGEQRAIAEALSDANAYIESLEKLIVKKRLIKQGVMQDLLMGKRRLPGFTTDWKPFRLSAIMSYERPDKYIVTNTEYTFTGNIPVLTANKGFILGYTHETEGICRNIPTIVFDDFTTDCKYADFPFKVKSSAIKLLRLCVDNMDLRFLFERMQLIRFPVGEHKRYYISEYQNLELLIPEHVEQQTIAKVLTEMDDEITALELQLKKSKKIKQGMMRELLIGRIRLV